MVPRLPVRVLGDRAAALRVPGASWRTAGRLAGGGLDPSAGRRAAVRDPGPLVQVGLRAASPDEHDWGEFAFYLTFFVAGYVVFSDQRLTAAVRRDLPIGLAVGVVGLAALVAADFPEWLERWSAAPSYSWDYLLMEGLYAVYAWSWTVVALGVGGRVKRFQRPCRQPSAAWRYRSTCSINR